MSNKSLWERYKEYLCICEDLGLTLDISRMNFDAGFLARMEPLMRQAYRAMEELEGGALANVDERRGVGHYWLRAPERAPDGKIAQAIRDTIASIKSFATQIHSGAIRSGKGKPFTDLLIIGIGGSVLGPQFIADALGHPASDRMTLHFLDNTDPDGMERLFSQIGERLSQTLTIVISKSGGTPETRNGMMVTQAMYRAAGLDFARHFVAVTGEGSHLEQLVEEQGWLARFPMWEWVGGRTSATSAVGLLPAALQGIDIDAFLEGAAACDAITRAHDLCHNPAALMALMWHYATRGRGERDMVVLPYKDRLMLLSRYLQQLIMESLGKAYDLDGRKVEQGIAVYGNKGSTDQHAYIQQLREGVNNFFVTFIEVLEDSGQWIEVEPGVTAGDYLRGFLLGTRQALYENGRESMTLTVQRVDARTIGILIALFERTVGLYASLVNINAYHQPGVEAGKKAAATVLELQRDIIRFLRSVARSVTADEVARGIGKPETVETVFKLLQALAVNRTEVIREAGSSFFQAQYRWQSSVRVR